MKHSQTLSTVFFFSGFRGRSRLQGIFGDRYAWLVTLARHRQFQTQADARDVIVE